MHAKSCHDNLILTIVQCFGRSQPEADNFCWQNNKKKCYQINFIEFQQWKTFKSWILELCFFSSSFSWYDIWGRASNPSRWSKRVKSKEFTQKKILYQTRWHNKMKQKWRKRERNVTISLVCAVEQTFSTTIKLSGMFPLKLEKKKSAFKKCICLSFSCWH